MLISPICFVCVFHVFPNHVTKLRCYCAANVRSLEKFWKNFSKNAITQIGCVDFL